MTMVSRPTSITVDEKLHRSANLAGTVPMKAVGARPRMVRLTVNLPSDLVEQIRDAVYWTPGLTLAWMIARAARISMAELEASNQGPFPKRAKPLRPGRPRLVGQSMRLQPPPSSTVGGGSEKPISRPREVSEATME